MEFLAGEVLIEAISKLAALSHSKLFLLLEDSLSNRSYAGSESLCAAFVEGSLKRKETDAKVDFDVNERRCVKTAGHAWSRGGLEVGIAVAAAASAAPVTDADDVRIPEVGGTASGRIDTLMDDDRSADAAPPTEFMPQEREEARSKRGVSTGNDFVGMKRIKTEPKSRSPSPSASAASIPGLGKLICQGIVSCAINRSLTHNSPFYYQRSLPFVFVL